MFFEKSVMNSAFLRLIGWMGSIRERRNDHEKESACRAAWCYPADLPASRHLYTILLRGEGLHRRVSRGIHPLLLLSELRPM